MTFGVPATYDETAWCRLLCELGVLSHTASKWACAFADEIQPARFSRGMDDLRAFIPQVLHETQMLERVTENLTYTTPERICKVWPSRFPTLASAVPFVCQPNKLANKVYAGRMGNGPESSCDGSTFKGRGLVMVTGRANYRTLGNRWGQDLEITPHLLEQPHFACESAVWWWEGNVPTPSLADTVLCRRRVNGGEVGLATVNNWPRWRQRCSHELVRRWGLAAGERGRRAPPGGLAAGGQRAWRGGRGRVAGAKRHRALGPGRRAGRAAADPATLVRLRELANQEAAASASTCARCTLAELQDAQAEHHETQETIRSGDNAEDVVVRRTRPLQSWAFAAGRLRLHRLVLQRARGNRRHHFGAAAHAALGLCRLARNRQGVGRVQGVAGRCSLTGGASGAGAAGHSWLAT
jgi:putative chitinase